jgi:hypothetical protein
MSEFQRTDSQPLPSPGVGTEVRVSTASRLRWIDSGGVNELELDLSRPQPALISVGSIGREFAALLLDAFDQAARTREHRVHLHHPALQLFLELPRSIEWPTDPPSWWLGGDQAASPSELLNQHASQSATERLESRLTELVGGQAVQFLKESPRRLRAAVTHARRLEQSMLRSEQAIRAHRRLAAGMAAVATAGLVGSFAATHLEWRWLLVIGAGLFAAGISGWALARRERDRHRQARSEAERRLGAQHSRCDQIERAARHLAHRVGMHDPWEVAARLQPRDSQPLERRMRTVDPRLDVIVDDLATLLETAPGSALAQLEKPRGELSGSSWPPDVDHTRACSSTGELLAEALAGLARLALRVQELPSAWPLVLWQPWSAASAQDRARLVMAAASIMSRPVIVITE